MTIAVAVIAQRHAPPTRCRSHNHQFQARIQTSKIIRVRCDDYLMTATGTDHNMSVGDIGRATEGEQSTNRDRIMLIQRHYVGRLLTNQFRKASLYIGPTYRLGKCRRRNGYSGTSFFGPVQQQHDESVAAIKGDQPASIKGEAVHLSHRPFLGLLDRPQNRIHPTLFFIAGWATSFR
jgi:hypothetical protein